MGLVRKSFAVLVLAGVGALAYDFGSIGPENYERVWNARARRIEERLDPKLAASRERARSYDRAIKSINATRPGDNAQIEELLNFARTYPNDERVVGGSMAALRHIGTPEAEQKLRSIVVNPENGEENFSRYAAGALGFISIPVARDAIIERGVSTGRLPDDLKDALYSIGDESSMEYFMLAGDAGDLAKFVIRNEGKPFLYPNSPRAIGIIERTLVKVYNNGEGIDCSMSPDHIYRLGHAVNALDRDHAEKYLLSVVESSGCSSILASSLRRNDFR